MATDEQTVSINTDAIPVKAIQPPSDLIPDHVIINQVYGGSNKSDGAVSHGFIELYNPTD